MIYIPVIYSVAHSQCNSPEIESSSTILEVWSLWPPGHQELLKNCKNWLSWWIFIFHVDIHSPAIPCPISLLFFSIHDLKLRTNEFVYDGMLCFPLNPYHCHVVLFTGLPTQPRFVFCMHNFWISPMAARRSTCAKLRRLQRWFGKNKYDLSFLCTALSGVQFDWRNGQVRLQYVS